jgi:hypothetical protein
MVMPRTDAMISLMMVAPRSSQTIQPARHIASRARDPSSGRVSQSAIRPIVGHRSGIGLPPTVSNTMGRPTRMATITKQASSPVRRRRIIVVFLRRRAVCPLRRCR